MPIVELPGGQVRDETRQPIYDTRDLIGAVSPVGTFRFYSNVQGKSLLKTNLQQNNSLPTATSFRCLGLGLDAQVNNPDAANLGVIPLVLIKSSLRLHVGEKDYWTGPARFVGGRMWAAYDNSAAATVLQQFGWAAVQPIVFQGKHVIDINPLQAFYCEQVIDNADVTAGEITALTPAADTIVSFVFSMKGNLRRAVQ